MWPARRLRRSLDPATALAAHARELARTAAVLTSEARSLAERAPALLAREERLGERLLRESEALDERQDRLTQVAAELAAREARLLADELGLRRRADELEAGERHLRDELEELAARSAHVLMEELRAPADDGSGTGGPEPCVLVVPSAEGYRLDSRELELPAAGETLDVLGEPFTVLRVGPSPLPGDARRCVYLGP